MHMYLLDGKGSEFYMRLVIQQLRDKGIPLTAKRLGFQCLWLDLRFSVPKFAVAFVADGPQYRFGQVHRRMHGNGLCDACSRHCEQRSLGAMPLFFTSPLPSLTTANLSYTVFLGAVYQYSLVPPQPLPLLFPLLIKTDRP